MGDESSANIFEEASKSFKQQKKAKKKEEEVAAETPTAASIPLDDDELERRYMEAQEKYGKLSAMTSDALRTLGKSADEATAFLNNPANFTPLEWESIQRQRASLESKLYSGSLGGDVKKAATTKSGKKKSKGKFLGGRKGWMAAD